LAGDEVRRTLDYVWSDPENEAKILKDLQEGDEVLYGLEKMLEASMNLSFILI